MVIFAVMAALCIGILIGMHLFQDRLVIYGLTIRTRWMGRIYIWNWIRTYPQFSAKSGLRSGSKPKTSSRTNNTGYYGANSKF